MATTSATVPSGTDTSLAKDEKLASTSNGVALAPPSPPLASSTTPSTPTMAAHSTPSSPSSTVVAPAATTVASTPTPALAVASSSASKPDPIASTSAATPGPSSTSNGTTINPNTPVQKPKKRKRKGLAAFFAALGCGGSDDLEDDVKENRTVKPLATSTTANQVGKNKDLKKDDSIEMKEKIKEGDKGKTVTGAGGSGGASSSAVGKIAAGAALTGGAGIVIGTAVDNNKQKEGEADVPEVVVPPIVPKEVPLDETEGMTSSAVQPPGSGSHLLPPHLHTPTRSHEDGSGGKATTHSGTGETEISDDSFLTTESGSENPGVGQHGYLGPTEEELEMDEEDRLISQGGVGIPVDSNGKPCPLLPPIAPEHSGRKCLVLDLDETLLHSSFKMIPSADYIVPVEIESQVHNVYVIKRPGVDNFLKKMGEIYEVVVFTASLSKYADPVLDMLDVERVVKHRLFRESCYNHKGNYVKDLSQLGRDMHHCIIIDNSPASYIFHPNNAVPVSTWFNDPHDTELTDLCPFLTDLESVDDIRGVLDGSL